MPITTTCRLLLHNHYTICRSSKTNPGLSNAPLYLFLQQPAYMYKAKELYYLACYKLGLKIKVFLCTQRTQSRKVQRAKEAKKKRYIDSLEQAATDERIKTCRKILKTLKQKHKNIPETPTSKTRRLLRYMHVSEEVRRTLTFHNAVISTLSERYRKCKTQVAKRRKQNLLMGRTIRLCKMKMFCRDVFGFSTRATV